MKKKEKLICILFIYDCIYSDYKKALRKRKEDGLYEMRKNMYEKYLKQFQEIILKDLKMKVSFTPLKKELKKLNKHNEGE